ncbi:MAG: DUF2796 domain-containing protein [Zoogloeaceae bacterium]|jgi:hypothetical protein|nr:DUF2796 domain-containing protein [Zoogloeaceae bacterium]
MMKKNLSLIAAFLLAWSAAPALGADAHTHGVASLNMAVEGDTLEIGFETPLINLISFEHAPRNDKERQEARKMAEILRNPGALFLFPKEAQCSLKSARLESEAIADELGHDDHDAKTEEAKHDHDEGEEHGDLDAEFVFTCRNPALLNRIEVALFKAFPSLKSIEAQLVTPRGQKAAKLTPRANRIQW